MTKRKTPAKPKPALPARGGSYVREKDGSLTPVTRPVAKAEAPAPTPDAQPEE